ncbi:hypothetical protein ORIO_03300 [Cereibacter azotoformans]|uniref:Uncharacterized protein n=2 Tax=Cereibacter TaxID=1653176 RepID=A0A2T5K6T0_9RHOB|nr:hypothetical protein [Cereibacter azotoformans]AXQ92873.1 hypothetical protein D0Z66_02965 [Cereibacter sphaeroides]MBO4169459.1 hypothetical protein [Cereibacter azotoformans]PTR18136.1 hypothetical protein C8J28_10993 [Cereibacter azotoformans]UIJ31157.1 hypothetical protein LV780_02970 [Cereibacter azotoformans]ULB08958.1 hypothetical protein ORIO_03300 [Cereibacter azotoformans]
MDFAWIIPFLFMFTLLCGIVFAMVSKKRVEDRRHDPNAPKSTLAKDGPQGGVAFLRKDGPTSQKPDAEPVLE